MNEILFTITFHSLRRSSFLFSCLLTHPPPPLVWGVFGGPGGVVRGLPCQGGSEGGVRDPPKNGQKVAISGPPQKWGQKWSFLHGETPPKMALFDAKSNFRYFSQGPLDKKRVLGVKILRGGVPRGFQINPLG